MSGSVRGSDLGAWWSNRAAWRKQAAEAVGQLRECQRQLSAAGGNTPAAATAPSSDASVEGIGGAARQILDAIARTQGELGGLSAARGAAQSELAQVKQRVESESARRTRDSANKDAERSLRSAKAAGWVKQKLFRLAGAGVFVLMLYVLAVY